MIARELPVIYILSDKQGILTRERANGWGLKLVADVKFGKSFFVRGVSVFLDNLTKVLKLKNKKISVSFCVFCVEIFYR